MEETNQSELSKDISVSKKTNYLPFIGILVVLAIIFVPGLLKPKQEAMESTPTPVVQTTPAPEPAVAVNGEISIEAGSFYYKPNVITVKKGEKVKITLNSVSMMHDFNIDVLGVKIPITKSGSTASVEFTPSEVGEFEYYCSVGQHRKLGQVGTLIVTE